MLPLQGNHGLDILEVCTGWREKEEERSSLLHQVGSRSSGKKGFADCNSGVCPCVEI